MKTPIQLLWAIMIMCMLSSCGKGGGGSALFIGESEPDDFQLKHKFPIEYKFQVPEDKAGKHDFALELTYYPEQLQDWKDIPMYYILVGPDKKEQDKRFKFTVRDELDWKGEQLPDGHDRRLEGVFEKGIDLAAGNYTFRLFGDSTDEKPIYGMVKVVFKVY